MQLRQTLRHTMFWLCQPLLLKSQKCERRGKGGLGCRLGGGLKELPILMQKPRCCLLCTWWRCLD